MSLRTSLLCGAVLALATACASAAPQLAKAPSELAERVTRAVSVPTIGIGAGPHCDGQVLVGYDLLGMYSELRPKFVKRFAEAGQVVVDAARGYVAEVQSGAFPTLAHAFGAPRGLPAPAEHTGAEAVVPGTPPTYGPASEES